VVKFPVPKQDAQARAFADRVIRVNDLLAEREMLRGAVAEVA